MTLYIYSSLNATHTITFGCIKWTPDVEFTDNFLGIVFGKYVRRSMGEKLSPKTQNEFYVTRFCLEILPRVSCLFCEK